MKIDEFGFYYNPHQFEIVTDDNIEKEGDNLRLIYKHEQYKYTFDNPDIESSSVCEDEKVVRITFEDNSFVEAIHNFKQPYSSREWEILSMINAKIKELQKEHDKAVKK